MQEREAYLAALFSTARDTTRDFAGVPTVSAFGDGKWFYTRMPISWIAEDEHAGHYQNIEVPIGFVTDLTSVPKPFWSLLPRDGIYLTAAIVHDYSYWMQKQSREASDKIFDIGMRELNVGVVKRTTIYSAVKIFGKSSWRKNAILRAGGERRVLRRYPPKPQIPWEEWKDEQDVFDELN